MSVSESDEEEEDNVHFGEESSSQVAETRLKLIHNASTLILQTYNTTDPSIYILSIFIPPHHNVELYNLATVMMF